MAGGLANPVWVDDAHFDMSYYVRRSALLATGLRRAARGARVTNPAAPSRPLATAVGGHLVEGLAEDRSRSSRRATTASSTASRLSTSATSSSTAIRAWLTACRRRGARGPEPSSVELIVGAVTDAVRSPSQVVDTVQNGVLDVKKTLGKVAGVAGEVV